MLVKILYQMKTCRSLPLTPDVAINPLSEQRLVCISYSLHKVGLHLRGDRHFEILYQCIQTLQNSLRMYELHDGALSFSFTFAPRNQVRIFG